MPCSSHHPVSSTRGWPLPLVSAYPGPSRGWAGNSGRAQRGIGGPGGSGAHGSHTMYSAPRRTSIAARSRYYAAAFQRRRTPLPSRATSGRSRNQASEKRLSVNPLDGARDQAAGRAWLRPTERSGSCLGPRCPTGTELAAVATLLEGSAPAPRVRLGQVDQLGRVVPAGVQPGRRHGALHVGVAGDAPSQGHRGMRVDPDAVVPGVVVLRAELEDRIADGELRELPSGRRDRVAR